nr:uncharacterized protein LOC109152041 [Ipomoea trifida]
MACGFHDKNWLPQQLRYVVELWGFREGLRLAKNLGFNSVVVESDSEALVQVFSNFVTCPPESDTLIKDGRFLISQFQRFVRAISVQMSSLA